MVWNSIYGRYALRTAIIIAALVLLAGGAGAATITVNTRGGADYTKIQDAIDNGLSREKEVEIAMNGAILIRNTSRNGEKLKEVIYEKGKII